MEKKILVYDDNGTESEEFCTTLADNSICASIFFSFSDTGLRDIANSHWNLYRYGFYGRFFMARRKKKGYSYRR